jgi:tripartite-type tricarboxylate transporter receptor subunit TctC
MQARWAALTLLLAAASGAGAQPQPDQVREFPSKPVRWVVGFAPGASNDVIARSIGARLSEIWGQQFIIVTASFPAKTPRELVDYLKANPYKVNWASAGVNSTPHVGLAIFAAATGVQVTHVPYKGATVALIDIVSGQVAGMHTSVASAESQIRSNRVRVIAVAGPKRMTSIPDVPTLAEAGIMDADVPNFYGMAAPLRTPPVIVRKLNAGFNQALASPDVRRRLTDLGMDVVGGTAEEAANFVQRQAARIRGLIEKGVLKPE